MTNTKEAVDYMVNEITHICRDMKKRSPGSEGEREAAEYMANTLRNECGCEQVMTETFDEHPDAFYGYFYISMMLNCLCALSFLIFPNLPGVCIALGAAALLIFLVQFVLYKEVIDPLFSKKQSVNVTAIRKAKGTPKRRILLNGHMDAAWEFPLNHLFGGVVFEIPGVMAIAGVIFYIAIAVCALSGAGAWTRTAGLWGLIFVPFFILVGWTYNPKVIVDGANDNLSGCYIGIALLRELEKQDVHLEDTEVGVILTGSEEAGLRGAKAWSKKHKDDFRDIPTYIISFDTIHDPKQLMVNTKDLNGTVEADAELGEAFLAAAERAGVPCKKGHVPLMGGATDSAAFSQGGFRSIGVTGLSHVLEDYYHTRKDSYDNLDREGLENCYKVVLELVMNGAST